MNHTELIEGELYQWVDSPITFFSKTAQAGDSSYDEIEGIHTTYAPFMFLYTSGNQCWFTYVNKFGNMKKGFLFRLEIKDYVKPAASQNE